MEEKDRQIIMQYVEGCFVERTKNTIDEKFSYCIKAGMSKDEARHTIIQIVKNLSNHLLLFTPCNHIEPTQKDWS